MKNSCESKFPFCQFCLTKVPQLAFSVKFWYTVYILISKILSCSICNIERRATFADRDRSHLKCITFRLFMKETSNSPSSWSICRTASHPQIESGCNPSSWRQLLQLQECLLHQYFFCWIANREMEFYRIWNSLDFFVYSFEELPSWLNGSVGRALHRYCRGPGFESCLDLISSEA